MADERELVFVYGTLRRGASNHFRMKGAELVGPATVGGKLFRIDWYPGLRPDPEGPAVSGEVYKVSAQLLVELDEFEGAAGEVADEFRRVEAIATLASDPAPRMVWLWEYAGSMEGCIRIPGGDWLAPGEGHP